MTAIERQTGIAEGIDLAAESAEEAVDVKQLLERLELGLTEALGLVAQSERNAAMMAVNAVLEFVVSVPGWERRDLGGPLWQLLTALKDLEFGRVPTPIPLDLATPDVTAPMCGTMPASIRCGLVGPRNWRCIRPLSRSR